MNERASPVQVGVAVGAGVFVGMSPAVGFHGGLAVLVATVLRVNRLFCFVGSRVSNPLIGPPLVFAQVQVAHRLRSGDWLALSVHTLTEHAFDLLFDWLLGLVTFGVALSLVLGLVAYALAQARANRHVTE